MSAGSICSRVVASVSPHESVQVAARRMEEYDVGTVVVLEANGPNRAVGILTDRDLAIRCVAHGLDPAETPVGQIMTEPVQSIDEERSIEEALALMVSAGVRRLIVTAKGQGVVGILSLDDVLDQLVLEVREVGRLLEQQRPQIRA